MAQHQSNQRRPIRRSSLRAAALAAVCAFASSPLAAQSVLPVSDWESFERIEDLSVVALNLSLALSPSAPVGLTYRSGGKELLQSCSYGPIEDVSEVDPSTPSNHLLVDIRPGSPERHAANGVFCEYALDRGAVVGEGFLTVQGCYLARVFSIPTARQVSLRPLVPQACGWAQ